GQERPESQGARGNGAGDGPFERLGDRAAAAGEQRSLGRAAGAGGRGPVHPGPEVRWGAGPELRRAGRARAGLRGGAGREWRWRGILNDGSNAVVLHSGEGPVRVMVLENAGTYGPELWDGWPSWPSEPHWLGRLGGYHDEEPIFGKGTPATPEAR